jgi:CBS domain-containing protein
VLGKLQDSEAGRVLVVQDGEVVGIITPTDLTRWLRRSRSSEPTILGGSRAPAEPV